MLNTGIILLWAGAIVDIPAGWALCDGNNGTPDLRDKFIPCAGSAYAVNATGGATTHVHSFTGDGHNHELAEGTDIEEGTGYDAFTMSSPAGGTTNAASSLPNYHALAFIMKT